MSRKFKTDLDTDGNWILNHPSTPTNSSHLTSKLYVDSASTYTGTGFIDISSNVVSLSPITGNIGNGISLTFNVSVPNNNVIVALYEVSTGLQMTAVPTKVISNTVTFTFTLAPSSNQYRYVII
jgi:hypothetical protein